MPQIRGRPRFAASDRVLILLALIAIVAWAGRAAWESEGHLMIGRAAAERIPDDMPAFFRDAADQLAYLNVEPDRWKDRRERDLDQALHRAYSPGHYINYEVVPDSVLQASDRLDYFRALQDAGVDGQPGFLPYVILELTQRLRIGFRVWRRAVGPEVPWIEQRIINDAGVLGHYVADASSPLHTSIHYNGWVGDNSMGYATDQDTHSRVEGGYVRTRISIEDVLARVGPPVLFSDLRPAIWEYLDASHALVERLYQIDQAARFDEQTTAEVNRVFIAGRLGAGAAMLRDLWWSAWRTSEP